MKYCPFCGTGLRADMTYCPQCGKRFCAGQQNPETDAPKWEEEVAPQTDELGAQESVVRSATPNAEVELLCDTVSTPIAASTKKSSKKVNIAILLIAILLVALVAVLAGIFIHFRGNKKVMDIQDAANSVLYLEIYDNHDNVTASASGFIINDGMTLVTNYHVIEHAYRIVAHTFGGNQSVEINDVVAYDNMTDLAILKCKENIGSTPLILGNSESVKQGNSIYVVGYPLGLVNTLSDGVVSSRYFDENNVDTIQITAPISSGSSGGPLFNEKGEVIGIVAAYYEDGQNMNIAIAVNELSPLLQSTSIIPLSDIYTTEPLEINEDEYLQATIDDLYNYPLAYDGENIKVEAWMSFYAHMEPVYSEHFYEIFLVDDKSAFLGDYSSLVLERTPSLFAILYESDWLQAKNVPYVVGRIYDSKLREEFGEREIRITCYGQFTYNPMEERRIDDPELYNLDIVAYQLGE